MNELKPNEVKLETKPDKYYHIFAIFDSEIHCFINKTKKEASDYLEDCKINDIKYGRVRVFFSPVAITQTKPKYFIKLVD